MTLDYIKKWHCVKSVSISKIYANIRYLKCTQYDTKGYTQKIVETVGRKG